MSDSEDGLPSGVSSDSTTHELFVRVLLMLVLICVAMNVNVFLKKINFHYVGETAVFIILGVLVAMGWTALSYDEDNKAIQLSSKLFYLVLLPPIIFEGGFTLQRISFFQNILTIIALAFAGALFATFVTALLMYFFSQLISPWSFIESLVFGSLISSTDPVTVLSLLPSSVDPRLYMLIFGESALNDAVSIILYRFFTDLADSSLTIGSFLLSVLQSAGVFLGSFLVGVIFGLALAKITKHVKLPEHEAGTYEMTMVLIFAYTSYLIADIMHLTGIISVFFTGITMAHYAYNNLSEAARNNLKSTLRMIAYMCECFIFIYLGLGLLSFGDQTAYSPAFVFFACVSILVSRGHIFLILGFSNLARRPEDRIPFNQQVLMWFSGLRGAVAFALGVTFLEHPSFGAAVKGQIFGTTVMVVVITVLVLGGLTPYMLKWLKLVSDTDVAATHAPDHSPIAATSAGGPMASHPADIAHHIASLGHAASLSRVLAEGRGKQSFVASPAVSMVAIGNTHTPVVVEAAPGGHGGPTLDEEAQIAQSIEGPGRSVVFAWLYKLDADYIRPYFTTLTENNKQTLHAIQQQQELAQLQRGQRGSRQGSILLNLLRPRSASQASRSGSVRELIGHAANRASNLWSVAPAEDKVYTIIDEKDQAEEEHAATKEAEKGGNAPSTSEAEQPLKTAPLQEEGNMDSVSLA